MAGSWIALVEGFGGFKVSKDKITINPKIPIEWKSFQFNIFYNNQIINFKVEEDSILISAENTKELNIENLSSKSISYE